MYIPAELRENVHDACTDGLNEVASGNLAGVQYAVMYMVNRHIETHSNPMSVIGALKVIEAEIYRGHIKGTLAQDRFDHGEI
jgi:hypothetical protein